MTLISAINEVCDIVALDRFDNVYGSNDPNAQTMVALAQDAGEEISRRSDWQRMLKQHVVLALPLSLPADFQRLTPGGAIRTATGSFFRPVTNSSQWAVIAARTMRRHNPRAVLAPIMTLALTAWGTSAPAGVDGLRRVVGTDLVGGRGATPARDGPVLVALTFQVATGSANAEK